MIRLLKMCIEQMKTKLNILREDNTTFHCTFLVFSGGKRNNNIST